MISRNDTAGFAQRTRKNLLYIEAAFSRGEDVHVITQLTNSLLGLVVFPWEHDGLNSVRGIQLCELAKQGWPQFQITMGHSADLGDLIFHLRNAIAHGHMSYTSDSRNESEVVIEVLDYKPRAKLPYWGARCKAADLHAFCLRLAQLVEDAVG
jgi:hypothetical protein